MVNINNKRRNFAFVKIMNNCVTFRFITLKNIFASEFELSFDITDFLEFKRQNKPS